MTRSEWIVRVFERWKDCPCPNCGRPHDASLVDENGNLWMWCGKDKTDHWLANITEPAHFDAEPFEPDPLPF